MRVRCAPIFRYDPANCGAALRPLVLRWRLHPGERATAGWPMLGGKWRWRSRRRPPERWGGQVMAGRATGVYDRRGRRRLGSLDPCSTSSAASFSELEAADAFATEHLARRPARSDAGSARRPHARGELLEQRLPSAWPTTSACAGEPPRRRCASEAAPVPSRLLGGDLPVHRELAEALAQAQGHRGEALMFYERLSGQPGPSCNASSRSRMPFSPDAPSTTRRSSMAAACAARDAPRLPPPRSRPTRGAAAG